MAHHLFKCGQCNNYTMKEACCGSATLIPRPPKYSPEDKYGEYRRKAKEGMGQKEENK